MSIYDKLLKVQLELKAPKNRPNSFGKYMYRSAEDILTAVKPLLGAQGLTLYLTDEIAVFADRVYVRARAVIHDGEETITNTAYAREDAEKKGMDGAQVTGTASSYARKYALNGLFLIDDTKDADTDEYAVITGKGKKISKSQAAALSNMLNDMQKEYILNSYGLNNFEEMTSDQYTTVIDMLKKKRGDK